MSTQKDDKNLVPPADQVQVVPPNYSPEDSRQIGDQLSKLLYAKMRRDRPHPEFNGKTYIQWYNDNERLANTFIERKEFDNDIVISSGTVEQKMFTVLSEINKLNLGGEVRVFDKDENELEDLATALTDVIIKTEELDNDKENKLYRQVELLKQGTAFIQENWVKEYKTEKPTTGNFNGKFGSVAWEKKIYECFNGPRRQLLYAPSVYLGNIRELDMRKQPYVFTMKLTSYSEAASRFGQKDSANQPVWERWASVPRTRVQLVTEASITQVSAKVNDGFSLTDLQQDMVEEIHYQDKYNNVYQIYLNGIAMLPADFPLTLISPSGEYNIEKQILQLINPFFTFGRSFVAKTRNLSDLLDEMLRLLILKTRKSIHPPYANISGRVISQRSLMPGRITMGIDPGSLVPIGQEAQGVTAAEYQMMERLQDNIDRVTISPQAQGQQGKSGTTAYEVNVLTQQAEKVLSLTVFACSMMEKKLCYLRLFNVLGKYFDPIDTTVDDARNEIKNLYRQTSRKTNIPGRGKGLRQIIPTDGQVPSSEEIMDQEDYQGTPEPTPGSRRYTREELSMAPIQKIFIDVNALDDAKLTFFIEIIAREDDTSSNAKRMFREQLTDIQALMNLGSRPNVQELEDDYARVWGKRKEKLFESPTPSPVEPGGGGKGIDLTKTNMPPSSPIPAIPGAQ